MTPLPIRMSDGTPPKVPRTARFALLAWALVGLGACAAPGTTIQQPEVAAHPQPAVQAPDLQRLVDRGDKALAAGTTEAALTLYQLALRHDPRHAPARIGVAEVRLASGDLDSARETYRALADDPLVGARAKQGLGLIHLRQGELREAKALLEEAVAARPDLWRAWNGLGAIHDSAREWADAEACYAKALGAAPNAVAAAAVRNNMGFSLMLQGRHAEAVTTLVAAVKADPELEVARTNLRLALAWQGRYREAVAGALPEERPTVLSNVGYVALHRGDQEEAERLFTTALEESPSHFEPAWLNLQHLNALRHPAARQSASE